MNYDIPKPSYHIRSRYVHLIAPEPPFSNTGEFLEALKSYFLAKLKACMVAFDPTVFGSHKSHYHILVIFASSSVNYSFKPLSVRFGFTHVHNVLSPLHMKHSVSYLQAKQDCVSFGNLLYDCVKPIDVIPFPSISDVHSLALYISENMPHKLTSYKSIRESFLLWKADMQPASIPKDVVSLGSIFHSPKWSTQFVFPSSCSSQCHYWIHGPQKTGKSSFLQELSAKYEVCYFSLSETFQSVKPTTQFILFDEIDVFANDPRMHHMFPVLCQLTSWTYPYPRKGISSITLQVCVIICSNYAPQEALANLHDTILWERFNKRFVVVDSTN